MTKRAHWEGCKKTFHTLAFAHIFIDHIVHLQRVPHKVVSEYDIYIIANYKKEVARIQ